MSPDQKGIETVATIAFQFSDEFTMSPDQKGIETQLEEANAPGTEVHNEPRSKGD
mgnify:CR=1 FL=1